jgi:hypothetical protein
MPVPGAAVLFPGELCFMVTTGLLRCRSQFATEPWHVARPDYKGSLNGGTKKLFRFGRAGEGGCRLAVTEAPIDALSLAAIDGRCTDRLYVATGGGIGPGTVSALQSAMRDIAGAPGARLVAATDASRKSRSPFARR